MSAHNTQQREVKKEKKITLNSRISPLEKDTIISSFFVLVFCKRRNVSLVFLSYSQRRSLSPKHTSSTSNFSLSLSFSLLLYKYMYIGEQRNNAPKPSPHARAHSRCARVVLRLQERKRNTTQNWIPNPKDRERKKKKIASLVSLLKHNILNKKPYLDANGVSSGTSRDYSLFERE